jgi:hypothetical protein
MDRSDKTGHANSVHGVDQLRNRGLRPAAIRNYLHNGMAVIDEVALVVVESHADLLTAATARLPATLSRAGEHAN